MIPDEAFLPEVMKIHIENLKYNHRLWAPPTSQKIKMTNGHPQSSTTTFWCKERLIYQWGWGMGGGVNVRWDRKSLNIIPSRQNTPWDLKRFLLCLWWYKLPEEGPHWVETREMVSLNHSVQQCSESPGPPNQHTHYPLPFFQLHPLTAFQIYFIQIRTPSVHHSGLEKQTHPLSN